MRYILSVLFFSVLVCGAAAGEVSLTGHWRFNLAERNMTSALWLLHLEQKDAEVAATADPLRGSPKVKIENIKLQGDILQMKLRVEIPGASGKQEMVFEFEGKLAKGGRKILGSMTLGGPGLFPVMLERTTARNIFELDRDIVTQTPNDPQAMIVIFDLIERAAEHKVSAKDLGAWVELSLWSADRHGPRYQAQHQLRLLEALRAQKAYAPVALATAKYIGQQVSPLAPLDTQLNLLSMVGEILQLAGERDAKLDARLDGLETRAYAAYVNQGLDFKTPRFPGRKAKGTRTVLVELFTGAQCPPCAAADLAFDGLARSYGAEDVVLLQYHLHIPLAEPMSNNDSDARWIYYAESYPGKFRATPSVLFNGKPEGPCGGSKEFAVDRYKMFCELANKHLESPDVLELTARAVRKGDKVVIAAQVDGVPQPGDKMRLRFALVEDWVRYKGSSGLTYHHRVVRAFPGGARGFAVKKKSGEFLASVDLGDLRKSLHRYLDDGYEGPRPMRLRDLHVVVFVQNDGAAVPEILHAIDVRVREE